MASLDKELSHPSDHYIPSGDEEGEYEDDEEDDDLEEDENDGRSPEDLDEAEQVSDIASLIAKQPQFNEKKGMFRILSTPGLMLAFLCFLSLCNYYDRGAFSGLVVTIRDEFDLDGTQAGLISGAFTVGYALASPIMAQLARHVPSGPLLMGGMLAWVLATGACTFATDFWYLMIARCFTGIGEAAFICLSPALIDDVAPKTQRTRWLAIFYSMLPIGYAMGYLGAGLFSSTVGWRWVFFSEALITLPFACLCVYLPNVKVGKDLASHGASTSSDSEPDKHELVPPKTLPQTLYILATNFTYVTMTLGYCAQTFVLGALTYWLPTYVHEVFKLDPNFANYIIGGTTAFCGIFGNVLAAFIMDYLVTKKRLDSTQVGVNLAVFFSFLAAPVGIAAVFMTNLYAFLVLMTLSEFLILCTVTPVNAVFLSVVTDDVRGHSVAMATLAIHLLGDMWSPYVYGAISDSTGQQQPALLFMSCWIGWTLIFWAIAAFFIRRRRVTYGRI